MQEQNYKNHRQFVPLYHFVLASILVLTVMASVINLYRAFGRHSGVYSGSLILLLAFISAVLFFYCRAFPLIAQDRAIRAEENLRHFALTGKLLDPRLTVKQIVALRFSSDEEFPALATRAAEENLGRDAIKLAIKHWRADTYRV